MADRKISTVDVDDYNTDTENLSNCVINFKKEIDSYTKAVEEIASACEVELTESLSEFGSTKSEVEEDLKSIVKNINTKLTKSEDKVQTNDQQLKSKLEERINEVNQLALLTSQYAEQVQGASSLSSSGLVSGLQAIGAKYNIDKISGVVEGREKKIEKTMKDASNVYLNLLGGAVNMSDKEIQDIVEKNYRHLTDEELEFLVEYYRNKMNKIYAEHTNIPFDGTDYELMVVDGKYQLAKIDPATGSIDFLNISSSASLGVSGTGTLKYNNEKGTSATISSAGASGSLLKGNDGNGGTINVGNAKATGSINNKGLSAIVGVNALEVGRTDIISWEDDLYKYGADVKVTFLSAQIGASLTKDGIKTSTPGLIGISISGGRVELIDINVDI